MGEIENFEVPERLFGFREHLHQIRPQDQSIPYNEIIWRRRFPTDPDLTEIIQRFPRSITRGNVFTLSREMMKGSSTVRKLFIATMIWGHDLDGRGPWKTSKMLDSVNAINVIQNTMESVVDGRIAEAYNLLNLNRCGPSFISKFLYFVGQGVDRSWFYPLILDSRVAGILRELVPNLIVNTTRTDPNIYLRYVNLIHNWANEISCRADAIELFFFNPPRNFS